MIVLTVSLMLLLYMFDVIVVYCVEFVIVGVGVDVAGDGGVGVVCVVVIMGNFVAGACGVDWVYVIAVVSGDANVCCVDGGRGVGVYVVAMVVYQRDVGFVIRVVYVGVVGV